MREDDLDAKRLSKDSFKDKQSTPMRDMLWVYEHLDLRVTAKDAPSGGAWSMLQNARIDKQKFFERFARVTAKMEDSELFEAEITRQTRMQDEEIASRLTPPKVPAERVVEFLDKVSTLTDEQWVQIKGIIGGKS